MKTWIYLYGCLLVFAGCATPPNRAYWGADPQTLTQTPLGNTPRPAEQYEKLTVIEFDEQGDLWDHEQLRLASARIKKANRRPLLVTYVHGWMNNARPDNLDLKTFSDFLKHIDQEVGKHFDVQGVFIGWRGRSSEQWLGVPVVTQIGHFGSFWSRKAATNRVAGIPLSQSLYSLVGEARERGKQLNGREPGIGILIGHSFGGRTLERTLGPAFVAQGAAPTESVFPADLVILINPATEALYARQLRIAMKKWDKDYPLVVSLTSKTDNATGWIWSKALELISFRPGVFLECFANHKTVPKSTFTDYRTYPLGNENTKGETLGYESQFAYIRSTSGHKPELVTHVIASTGETVASTNAFQRNLEKATSQSIWINFSIGGAAAYQLQDSTKFYYEYKERNDRQGRTEYRQYYNDDGAKAYWIVRVPTEILPNHSGFTKYGGIFSESVSKKSDGRSI